MGILNYSLENDTPFGGGMGMYFHLGNNVPTSSVLRLTYLLIASQISLSKHL